MAAAKSIFCSCLCLCGLLNSRELVPCATPGLGRREGGKTGG